jgi:phospholipase/lecithinase/hemolysin
VALHRGALRRALAATDIPYLELPELTEGSYPANRQFFAEEIHPNARGHRLIADRLLAFLAARGLLGGLRAAPGADAGVPPAHPAQGRDPVPGDR